MQVKNRSNNGSLNQQDCVDAIDGHSASIKNTQLTRNSAFSVDGHPIIANYVLVSHAARHLKNDVMPHGPEHNFDYRTPGFY